jgi:hypothetical protein
VSPHRDEKRLVSSCVSILDGIRDRQPFAGEWGRTGAKFERGILVDGTPVVIKHITQRDWLIAVGGGRSRLYEVWQQGLIGRVPEQIDHTMLAMEEYGDGWICVMRDASEEMLAEGCVLTRAQSRRLIAAADALHAEFWGEEVPGFSLYEHYAAMTPKRSAVAEHLDTPIPGLIRRGWELFSDVAPNDVTGVMHHLIDEPAPLVRQMEKHPTTLIHGDYRLHNLGLNDENVVVIDWEVVGTAPPAVEFAWYLIISATRIDASREQVIDDYRQIAGDRFDPVAWDLACIGALMWLGWNKAIDILENPDPAIRTQERADLDWWIVRVREALGTWSPV